MVDKRNELERRWMDTLQRKGLPRDHSVLQCMEKIIQENKTGESIMKKRKSMKLIAS